MCSVPYSTKFPEEKEKNYNYPGIKVTSVVHVTGAKVTCIVDFKGRESEGRKSSDP